MCTKRKFPDEISANFAIAKYRSQRGRKLKGKFEASVYPCTMGGTRHWHLTSQINPDTRRVE